MGNIYIALGFVVVYYGIYWSIQWMEKRESRWNPVGGKNIQPIYLVKNAAGHIEHIIQRVGKSSLEDASEQKVTLIDVESEDETLDILRRIEKKHENIEVFTYKERQEVFERLRNRGG